MNNKFLWIIAVTFSFIIGQTAFAHSGRCGNEMHKMMESLNLDKDQKAKMQPVVEQFKSTMKANWSQMKDIRSQIKKQVQSDNMDKATVDGLIDKQTKLMGDMMRARIMAKHEMFTVLNAQQKATLQSKEVKWEEKAAKKMEECKEQE